VPVTQANELWITLRIPQVGITFPMFEALAFFDLLWDILRWAPFVVAILGGVILGAGLFSTRGWQPTCRRCHHDLRRVQDDRCPECGAELASPRSVRTGARRISVPLVVVGVIAIALGSLPQFGLRPQDLRLALARRAPKQAIAERWMKGDNLATAIHLEYVRTNDAEYDAILIAAAIDRVKNGPLPGTNDPLLSQLLVFRQQASSGDTARLIPLLKALVERASASAQDAKAVRDFLPLVDLSRIAEGRQLIAASDALMLSWLYLSDPPQAVVGEPVPLQAGWNGMMIVGEDLRPTIDAARWRPAGSKDWKPLSLPDSDSMFPQLPAIEHEGGIEVELELTLDVPAKVAGTTAPARTLMETRRVSFTQVRRDSIVGTPVRGGEIHELLQPTLNTIRLAKFGSSIQPRITFSGRSRARSTRSIQFGGAVLLRYDGKDYPIGEFTYSSAGGGGGGSSGNSGLESVRFEPGKPLVLRFVPKLEIFRQRLQQDFEYADEIIEIEFDGFDQPAKEIRWVAPTATSS
jgi:hypothetical protein